VRQGGQVVMTHPSELDATEEIPADFTSHLAERLQLAPDAAQAHLESWLMHYTRPRRELSEPLGFDARPSDLCVPLPVG